MKKPDWFNDEYIAWQKGEKIIRMHHRLNRGTHVTKNDKKIKIKDMSNAHLMNTYKLELKNNRDVNEYLLHIEYRNLECE